MHRYKWLSWLKKVFLTQEEEILCSECLDRMHLYVEQALQGQDVAKLMPEVHQHLEQCAVCWEEYELLHDLAIMESGGDELDVDQPD